MDVAAEEYRQRGPMEQPEPDFNPKDELNALLGDSKTKQAPVEIGAPAVSVGEPWTSQTTAYESAVSDAFRPLASTVFGSAARAEPVWDRGAPEEPGGVQSPEHPADIH